MLSYYQIPDGTMVGEYEITGLLGEGTYGTVYAAYHPIIGKRAAVKVLKHDAASDEEMVERFKGEALAVNAIAHPNIVDIFGFGHLPDGRPYLIMELLQGASLEDLLEDNGGRLSAEQTLPILRSVALAVDAAHEAGVVHRDLKPDNIFVARPTPDMQVVKVLDFGVAKLMFQSVVSTTPGLPVGTPLYMSPEQCLGARDVDYRTDIYSFGVTAFRCLTGDLPVYADTYAGIVQGHLSGVRTLASEVDAGLGYLDEVLGRCMAPQPEARYASLGDAYQAILEAHCAYTDTPVPTHFARVDTAVPAYQSARESAGILVRPSQPLSAEGTSAAARDTPGGTLPGPLAAARLRSESIPDLDPKLVADRAPSAPVARPTSQADQAAEPRAQSAPIPAPEMATGQERALPTSTTSLYESTLGGANAELQYQLRNPYTKPVLTGLAVAAALGGLVLVFWLFAGQGDDPGSREDTLEQSLARALDAKRTGNWRAAELALQDVLHAEPDHARAKALAAEIAAERKNEERYGALLVAVNKKDIAEAKRARDAIPDSSFYSASATADFSALVSRWSEEQEKALGDLLRARECSDASSLRDQILEFAPAKEQSLGAMFKKARCGVGGEESRRRGSSRKARSSGSRDDTGTAWLTSKPSCEILVDGEFTGLWTPQRALELSAGRHKITLYHQEFGIRESFTLTVEAGRSVKSFKDLSDRVNK